MYLDLSGNKIKKLVNGTFNGLVNVKRLDIHLNDIGQIGSGAFANLMCLEYLNLDSNSIQTLKNVQFGLKLLELSLRFNKLSDLSEIYSQGLNSLIISNNRIQTVNFIVHLSNLEYLDLSQNGLIKIEKNSFSHVDKLRYLNLSGNKLDLDGEFLGYSQTCLESLDLSFNDIKYIESANLTFQYLSSLKALNMSNNQIKSLDSNALESLSQLSDLNLAWNNIGLIKRDYFLNLRKLRMLKIGFNLLESIDILNNNLEYLDLEQNKLDKIGEHDFEFNLKLKFLNLNSNPIQKIDPRAIFRLTFLKTLKLANTSLNEIFLTKSLKELDLSYLNVSITNIEHLNLIEWINLANTRIRNISFDRFISNSTRYVDLSFNFLNTNNFEKLNILSISTETLILRQTNLQQIEHITFENLINLKYLDLSFNNLTYVGSVSFAYNKNLEHLDLSSNKLYEFDVVLNKLKYLNLENNRIVSINDQLFDYFSMGR